MSNHSHKTLSHDVIVRALFENYESIYAVDEETSFFQCFHESDPYSMLCLDEQGDNFFDAMMSNIHTIYSEDQELVRNMLSKEALSTWLSKDKFYSFVYRLMIDGKPLYHKLRATKELIGDRPHFLIGIRNVDSAFRQDKALAEKMATMHSKDLNHLEAILAGAEGYLEVDLTKDAILEFSFKHLPTNLPDSLQPSAQTDPLPYSSYIHWYIDNMITENKARFARISDRAYLMRCFRRGEKRSSVSFSVKAPKRQTQPCKMVYYLYQDAASGNILSFCVLYDLTEQQRKEKELRDLENELQMIRLRNFTSQMQPHFLYNALGSIQEIVLVDPTYAADLIGDFSIHLRSCIRAMANDAPIPFDQELENIKAYVNIEKMRFGSKLNVLYDIQETDFSILPLSVQPLVENAIRHGIFQRGEQGGHVIIRTEKNDSTVRITIEDNGVGFDVEKYREDVSTGSLDSTGLKNILFRLDIIMHATVEIDSVIGKGTTVTLTIPKEFT